MRHLPRPAIGFYRAKLVGEPHGRAIAGRDSWTFWPAQSPIHSLCHLQSPGSLFVQRRRGHLCWRLFWDGRTPDTATQARMPFLDQNEMANVPVGPYPPHAGGYSPRLAAKVGPPALCGAV